MASHANSTTAPAVQARLLPRRDARGRFVKLARSTADEMLAEIAAEIDRQEAERADDADAPAGAHDPAFATVRALDAAVVEWDGAFAEYLGIMEALDPDGCADWNDPRAVARDVLGPLAGSTVAALDGLLGRLGTAGDRLFRAEDEILDTRAATEIGAAALRAAVRRYARRPFGCGTDEGVMLARLAA